MKAEQDITDSVSARDGDDHIYDAANCVPGHHDSQVLSSMEVHRNVTACPSLSPHQLVPFVTENVTGSVLKGDAHVTGDTVFVTGDMRGPLIMLNRLSRMELMGIGRAGYCRLRERIDRRRSGMYATGAMVSTQGRVDDRPSRGVVGLKLPVRGYRYGH